ncbi:hypothetical protein DPMN_058317 [Dreissena polymorpha]|uniref:Uncharacterized protein n=1 Tax=Dreissena polymorpha TaxID=45954 RepID=A0A9D4C1S8_DREPO|nr:hypothetical protein DPMN_058317 [Dreissena polymorpha]
MAEAKWSTSCPVPVTEDRISQIISDVTGQRSTGTGSSPRLRLWKVLWFVRPFFSRMGIRDLRAAGT